MTDAPDAVTQVARDLSEHGTRAAYLRHVRTGVEPCDACRKAQADYMREYRERRPSKYAEDKEMKQARDRALRRLGRMHPALLEALILEELSK